ncbi:hypothetical protein MTP04_04460 [Lysinibacillus sp. PLM2]|nr:hypothetical protein MTP04_04460 [Lysinibacillus sp. PLM2]
MKTVMVFGASGVLGQLVCTELLRIFENEIKLIVTDYKMDWGEQLANSLDGNVEFRYLNRKDDENISKAIQNMDIVIVVLKYKTRTNTNQKITSYIARVFLRLNIVTRIFHFV